MLDFLGLPYEVLDGDCLEGKLDRLLSKIEGRSIPGALLVRQGVLQ